MKPVLQFFACALVFAVLGAPAHGQETKADGYRLLPIGDGS